MGRYFAKLPAASPSTVQVENTNFGVLIKILLDNTVQMVQTESKAQLLLKFRFALHLLNFVNEDSRLLVLKLANVIAGLTCEPLSASLSRFLPNCCFFLFLIIWLQVAVLT